MSLPLAQYATYVPLNHAERILKLTELLKLFICYLRLVGINTDDVAINKDNLLEIIERVEKRRVYFKVFYDRDMAEKNEASLYCFCEVVSI